MAGLNLYVKEAVAVVCNVVAVKKVLLTGLVLLIVDTMKAESTFGAGQAPTDERYQKCVGK